MNINELYSIIRKGRDKKVDSPTFKELEITEEKVYAIDSWARDLVYGSKAAYIPELASEDIDIEKTGIAIADLGGNKIIVGNGKEVIGSIQSVIKPFLYLYALSKGVSPHEISGVEANALPFNADQILQPELRLETAQHPLNNAGAVSSAGVIGESFSQFLDFMCKITRNPDLKVIDGVFNSEMATNSNNKAIAYRLVAAGRFKTQFSADKALENYTRACSIGVSVRDLLFASLVLASGGFDYEMSKRIVSEDACVRVMNAMNSFGMYEETGRVALLVAGARANTCKSGVGGFIININPDVGAFSTYNPLLNAAGNSVYGLNAMIPLNELSASPGKVRLSFDEIEATRKKFEENDLPKTYEEIMSLISNGFPSSAYKAKPFMTEKIKDLHIQKGKILDKL